MPSQEQNSTRTKILQEIAAIQAWNEAGAIVIPLHGRYLDDYSQVPDAEYDRWKIPLGSWKGDREKLYQQAIGRFKANDYWIGLVPAGLGLVCIDVDSGDHNVIADLLAQYKIPSTSVQTKRGWHVFARARGWPPGNFTWEFAGAKGDIRFDKGYVVVWDILAIQKHLINTSKEHQADSRIARTLKQGKQKAPAPKDLFDACLLYTSPSPRD